MKKTKKMPKVEAIMQILILSFCENLAEIGCPQSEKNSDMWYRYLSSKQQKDVCKKLLKIIERNYDLRRSK